MQCSCIASTHPLHSSEPRPIAGQLGSKHAHSCQHGNPAHSTMHLQDCNRVGSILVGHVQRGRLASDLLPATYDYSVIGWLALVLATARQLDQMLKGTIQCCTGMLPTCHCTARLHNSRREYETKCQ